MNRYRSLFWPGVLILAGVIALLVNTGVLPVERLWELVALWPLILVVIGLELIVRRTVHGTTGDIATALVVLIAIVGAAAYVTYAPNPAATMTHDYSAPVGDLNHASLAIGVPAGTITITGSGDLGADLYRAHIESSGPTPEINLDSGGDLNISQPNRNMFGVQGQRFVLNLALNPSVVWAISEQSGASNDTLQLGSLHVVSMKLSGGARHDDITLGPPSGPVPVTIQGGALTVGLHRPSGTKVSVEVSGGAVTLVADGRSQHAVGKVEFISGDLGSDYYKIQVSGGACNLVIDTSAPSG